MLFRTHVAFGVLVYFFLNFIFQIPNKILFFIFVVAGAIIVDIDLKNSKVGKNIFLRPFQFFIKHRGMVHSFLFGIFFAVLIAALNEWAGFGFLAGFMSHLFLDFLSSGIEFFWPWKKRIGIKIAKTGGIVEEIFFVLLLLADFWFIVKMIGVI